MILTTSAIDRISRAPYYQQNQGSQVRSRASKKKKKKTSSKTNLAVEPLGAPGTINPQKTASYSTGLAQEKKKKKKKKLHMTSFDTLDLPPRVFGLYGNTTDYVDSTNRTTFVHVFDEPR